MCGEDVECFNARRWRIGANTGDVGTSRVVFVIKSFELVFKLSWLGFRFIAGILGLIKDGEDGSDTKFVAADAMNGG
jgi:hypothetical protein